MTVINVIVLTAIKRSTKLYKIQNDNITIFITQHRKLNKVTVTTTLINNYDKRCNDNNEN